MDINLKVMRAFVRLRQMLALNGQLASKLGVRKETRRPI
jgi:hypothetical protein